MVTVKTDRTSKSKPMSQKEIGHFTTQNKRLLVLSNKFGNTKPFDLWDLETERKIKIKNVLKDRKVFSHSLRD